MLAYTEIEKENRETLWEYAVRNTGGDWTDKQVRTPRKPIKVKTCGDLPQQPYPGMIFKKDYEPRYFFGALSDSRPTKRPKNHFNYPTRK